MFFFFSSRRRHTRCSRDWSSDVCSSDLPLPGPGDPTARGRTPSFGEDTTPGEVYSAERSSLAARVRGKDEAALVESTADAADRWGGRLRFVLNAFRQAGTQDFASAATPNDTEHQEGDFSNEVKKGTFLTRFDTTVFSLDNNLGANY